MSKAVEDVAVDHNKNDGNSTDLDHANKDQSTREDLNNKRQDGQKPEENDKVTSQEPSGKNSLGVNPFDPQDNIQETSDMPNNAENRRSIQTPVFKSTIRKDSLTKKADDDYKTPEKPSHFDFTKEATEETSPLPTIEEQSLSKSS